MKAEILAVGTELLLGQILNTNAQYLAKQLAELGITLHYQTVVGDNPQRLTNALDTAFGRADLVITTGGLGPTQDDLTKETVAAYFDAPMVLHEDILAEIKAYFRRMERPFTDNNIKQAEFPEGSFVIPNNNGTAPGCIIEKDGKIAVVLPGPPRENIPMFEDTVKAYLREKSGIQIFSRTVHIFGIGEATLEQMLLDLIEGTDPTVATYAKDGEVEVRVSSAAQTEKQAQGKIEPVLDIIRERAGDAIYGYDDTSVVETVLDALKNRGWKLATAESCTGGMIASALVDISGSSEVFEAGFVTYANRAKMKMIGVQPQTLEQFGAVSEQTAQEMAEGARREADVDIAVSVTGVAGPLGGTPEKPVGLVYIAVATGEKTVCQEFHFPGNRLKIRTLTMKNALKMVLDQVK